MRFLRWLLPTALLAAPVYADMPGDFSALADVLIAIAEFIRDVLSNDDALFLIVLVIIFIIFNSILKQGVARIPIFGGGQTNRQGRILSVTLSLLITLALGWQWEKGALANTFPAGRGVFLLGALLAILLFMLLHKAHAGLALSTVVVGLTLIGFGRITEDTWLIAAGSALMLFGIFSWISRAHLRHESPYAHPEESSHKRREWFHKLKNISGGFLNYLKKAGKKSADTGKRLYNMAQREQKEGEGLQQFQRLRQMSEDAFQSILNTITSQPNLNPQHVREIIEKELQRTNQEEHTLERILESEKEAMREEELSQAQMEEEESELSQYDESERSLGDMGEHRRELEQAIKEDRKVDHEVEQDLKQDEKLRRDMLKRLKREKEHLHQWQKQLSKLHHLMKRVESGRPLNEGTLRKVIDRLKRLQAEMKRKEYDDLVAFRDDLRQSSGTLKEAIEKNKEGMSTKQELEKKLRELEEDAERQ